MVLRLAGRGYTIMARRTVIDDTGMIEYRRCKATARGMADVAILCRRNMIRRGTLAGCIHSVMTGVTALTQNLRAGMVDKRIGEIRRVMAHAAILSVRGRMRRRHPSRTGRNMVGTAVVARFTVTGNTLV